MKSRATFYLPLAMVFAWFVTSCGGAMPTTPTDVPTTVEYNSGDIMISGSMSGLSSSVSSVKDALLDASGTYPDEVALIDLNGNIYAMQFAGDCVIGRAPNEAIYAVVFRYGSGYRIYKSSTLGVYSTPYQLNATSAASSGTLSFYPDDGCNITSSDIPVTYLGNLTASGDDYVLGDAASSDLIASFGFDPSDPIYANNLDLLVQHLRTSPANGSEAASGLLTYRFYPGFKYDSSQSRNAIINDDYLTDPFHNIADPSLFSPAGFQIILYSVEGGAFSGFVPSDINLYASIDITDLTAVTYVAGDPIPASGIHPDGSIVEFLGYPDYGIDPFAGDAAFTNVTFRITFTHDIGDLYFRNFTPPSNMPVIVVNLNRDVGGNIVSTSWRWYGNIGGSWQLLTPRQVVEYKGDEAAAAHSTARGVVSVCDGGVTWRTAEILTDADMTTEYAQGTTTFDVPITSFCGVNAQYLTDGYVGYNYNWNL